MTEPGPKNADEAKEARKKERREKAKGVRFEGLNADEVKKEMKETGVVQPELNAPPPPPPPPPPSVQTRPRSPDRPEGTPKMLGIVSFSDSIAQKSKEFEDRRKLIDAANEEEKEALFEVVNGPKPEARVGVILGGNQAPIAGDIENLDAQTVGADALNSSSASVYASQGGLNFEKLKKNTEAALGEPMDKRIAAFGTPDSIMKQEHYDLYKDINPFDELGKKLSENKSDPTQAFDLLTFVIQGAKRECKESPSMEAKAKLMALEQVKETLTSMTLLDKNNCRYSKAEFAKKMAVIDAIMLKTKQPDNSFTTSMSNVLGKHRYTERTTVVKREGMFGHRFSKTAERGKTEFDTSKESISLQNANPSRTRRVYDKLFHGKTASYAQVFQISSAPSSNVVHLTFSFDREKVLKGDKKEMKKMQVQVAEALRVTMVEYGIKPPDPLPPGHKPEDYKKGGEQNPISISNRPPSMNQPETALTMLLSIKATAISTGKSIFVVDPNNPAKKVEFTAKADISNDELGCFTKFANEKPTSTKGNDKKLAGDTILGLKPDETGKIDPVKFEGYLKTKTGEFAKLKVTEREKGIEAAVTQLTSEKPKLNAPRN